MKKIIALALIIVSLLSFYGCSSYQEISVVCTAKKLYDKDGNLVQVWTERHVYPAMEDADGSCYVEITSVHDHETKVKVDEDSRIVINEYSGEYLDAEEAEQYRYDCLRPAATGENAYVDKQIVNVYYLDREATNPVLIVTDSVDGEVKCTMITSETNLNGERYFVILDGNGGYSTIVFDFQNPDQVLSALPERSLVSDRYAHIYVSTVPNISGTNFNGNTAIVEIMEFGKGSTSTELEVVRDENGQTFLVLPTITNEKLYALFDNSEDNNTQILDWAHAEYIYMPIEILVYTPR